MQMLMEWSLQKFAYGMTAVLMQHVQKFVAIQWTGNKIQWIEISSEFGLSEKLSMEWVQDKIYETLNNSQQPKCLLAWPKTIY